MHPVLLKQKRLQVASEGGTVEIRVLQFIRQWIPSCWRSHSKGTTTIRVQLEPWGDEQVAAGWTEMLSFSDLSDQYAQLRQVVGRVAAKTLVYHPAELVRDPICHIEPMQLSMKVLCQTTVVLLCAAHNSCCSIHDSLQLVDDSLGWSDRTSLRDFTSPKCLPIYHTIRMPTAIVLPCPSKMRYCRERLTWWC